MPPSCQQASGVGERVIVGVVVGSGEAVTRVVVTFEVAAPSAPGSQADKLKIRQMANNRYEYLKIITRVSR
jgi:hypothetical protein